MESKKQPALQGIKERLCYTLYCMYKITKTEGSVTDIIEKIDTRVRDGSLKNEDKVIMRELAQRLKALYDTFEEKEKSKWKE